MRIVMQSHRVWAWVEQHEQLRSVAPNTHVIIQIFTLRLARLLFSCRGFTRTVSCCVNVACLTSVAERLGRVACVLCGLPSAQAWVPVACPHETPPPPLHHGGPPDCVVRTGGNKCTSPRLNEEPRDPRHMQHAMCTPSPAHTAPHPSPRTQLRPNLPRLSA
jgi:hypothetical protein